MTVRNLTYLFAPKSVAVIGASNTPGTVGAVVMRNLLQGGFSGPIMPVNPKHEAVAGVLAYPDVASLPKAPDLAVVCVPPDEVPKVIGRLGERGTRAAVVVTAGMALAGDADGEGRQRALLEAARPWRMRILGPNTLGLAVPAIGLNASFMHHPALPGKIAFVSQSGALCTAVLDWARPKGIGFSHFVSLGDCADIDFGDLLDYLGSDPHTRAILLYIETIRSRRNFMSAARAAARNKPVLCIRAGRMAEAARAAASHTGTLAGADDVVDAAIRRAGMLRVRDIDELFAAVETLSRARPLRGERLAIVTNGGGIGVMAVDELIADGGTLASLSETTLAKLDAVVPRPWARDNPVDLTGAATGERFAKALAVLTGAPEVDATLVMYAPTALTSATEVAGAVIQATKEAKRANIMTCWVGEDTVQPARQLLRDAAIPAYETPGGAVRAFLHLVEYRRNQVMLMETPPSAPTDFTPATATARLVIENAFSSGNLVMSEPESKAVLAAYGIPTVETLIGRTPVDAARLASRIGKPVALKILSPDIAHKSDVGGVVLNLQNPFEVEKAAHAMQERVHAAKAGARIQGFTVQEMVRRPGAHELILGVTTDPIFGPVILFGQGGTAVEVIGDRAVALPPLNMALARDLISRTRVAKLLHGHRHLAAVDLDAICLALCQVSQLIIDIPQIAELDINPLFADSQGVLALDALIRVTAVDPLAARLAIRPYPKALEEVYVMPDARKALLRPIRPEDEPNHHVFVSKLTQEDIRFRFFGLVGSLPHTEMARMTQIDYDREMAFIATTPQQDGGEETLGVVRTHTDPDNERAEFAIVVRSDLKGMGLGRKLLDKMIRYCRARGTQAIIGQVLMENHRMLKFTESLGFRRMGVVDGDVVEIKLELA